MEWITSVITFFGGIAIKLFYDLWKDPHLEICGVSTPFKISEPIRLAGVNDGTQDYLAYRIKVRNKQRILLNAAAENCVAWLDLDLAPEPYQLSWVGELESLTINVGDERSVNLCALNKSTGIVFAPTERGYFDPRPRMIGDISKVLYGEFRVTSRNGKSARRKISISPIQVGELHITLE